VIYSAQNKESNGIKQTRGEGGSEERDQEFHSGKLGTVARCVHLQRHARVRIQNRLKQGGSELPKASEKVEGD
jgi:hypothetical protein